VKNNNKYIQYVSLIITLEGRSPVTKICLERLGAKNGNKVVGPLIWIQIMNLLNMEVI
jgi:hypothetical protein